MTNPMDPSHHQVVLGRCCHSAGGGDRVVDVVDLHEEAVEPHSLPTVAEEDFRAAVVDIDTAAVAGCIGVADVTVGAAHTDPAVLLVVLACHIYRRPLPLEAIPGVSLVDLDKRNQHYHNCCWHQVQADFPGSFRLSRHGRTSIFSYHERMPRRPRHMN